MIDLLIYLCLHLYISLELTYYCSGTILQLLSIGKKTSESERAKILFCTKVMKGLFYDGYLLIVIVIIGFFLDPNIKLLRNILIPLILSARLIVIGIQYNGMKTLKDVRKHEKKIQDELMRKDNDNND